MGDITTVFPGVSAGANATFGIAAISLLSLPKTDISGTPGNGTVNTMLGRCAIAAAASSVVITSSIVTTASRVFAQINQAAADGTCTEIVRVSVGNGSFTIFGIAAATAATVVDFIVYP